MKVQLRDIGEIRPYEKNPRINDQAVDAVAASLRQFGFRQPIVVDADGVIIVGHTRWKAAMKLCMAALFLGKIRVFSPKTCVAITILCE